jgi:hypothetical protein
VRRQPEVGLHFFVSRPQEYLTSLPTQMEIQEPITLDQNSRIRYKCSIENKIREDGKVNDADDKCLGTPPCQSSRSFPFRHHPRLLTENMKHGTTTVQLESPKHGDSRRSQTSPLGNKLMMINQLTSYTVCKPQRL